jgi:uncharacterized protein with von Willebrand factor type A (vWA) domain
VPPPPSQPPGRRPDARRAALYGGTSAGPSPRGLAARLLEFGEELRGEGVAVGTSELLDAFAALQHVPWTEPAGFREALSATIAKSPEDRRIFALVFDRFFFRAAELAAVQEGVREEGGIDPDGAGELDLDLLRQLIAEALRDGDEAGMADLARLAIAAFGRQGEGSGVIGVDVQRIRRQLALKSEPQPDLPLDDPRRDGLPREEIRRFEAHLRRSSSAARSSAPRRCPPPARSTSSTARCRPGRCRTWPRSTRSSPSSSAA